jgi:hypothetical protein
MFLIFFHFYPFYYSKSTSLRNRFAKLFIYLTQHEAANTTRIVVITVE